MFVLAHAGHWAVNLLYVAPLVITVAILGYQSLTDRRSDKPRKRLQPTDHDD